jgi:hypothetical protein
MEGIQMPVADFDGECFVAFTDISGFKEMMKRGPQAMQALDCLYTSGYNAIQDNRSVNGFFVSDCGILFTREGDAIQQLQSMLHLVNRINRDILAQNIMLTTSVAWGHFSYHNRIEFPGVRKQATYGNAYIAAYLDSHTELPKISPGQCRIRREGLPDAVLQHLSGDERSEPSHKHFYYHWMVNDPEDIPDFTRLYNDSYTRKYAGMLDALKQAVG